MAQEIPEGSLGRAKGCVREVEAAALTWPRERGEGQRLAIVVRGSDSLQVFDQVLLVRFAEIELEVIVVVIDHIGERGKTAVVVEAALLMRPQARQRRGAVHVCRRAVGLK